MATNRALRLQSAAEVAADVVLNGHVERWVEGAIFPCEMAFFIATCIANDIECVIESGRQDGYSTEILGDWASRGGQKIVSIDLELEPERAALCRERLAKWPIELVKGSAYEEFGRHASAQAGRKLALLADGPKGWPAISMLAAATSESVRVVALHNLIVGCQERRYLQELGGGSDIFYETAIPAPGPRWRQLRERELSIATKAQAARSLEASSLGVLVLDEARRSKFRRVWRTEFGLHQPAVVRTLWASGMYAAATKLYGLSYRILAR
ncbi:hypothetical protein [Bradyrhizobium sp. 25ACV]